MCECYQIGGRFIAEDPDCPVHGTDARKEQHEREAAIAADRERSIEIVERELDSNGQSQAIALAIRGDADLSRRDDAPDYRTAEQFYADAAHLRRRKELNGE